MVLTKVAQVQDEKITNRRVISLNQVAENVTGVTVPNSGHWIPEEQPKFLVEQLTKFFNE